MQNKWISLACWIILFEVIGFVLGRATQAGLVPWYAHLAKSSLTPPGAVFGIVWSSLYALLAVVGWSLTQQRNKSATKLYALQMLMNWAWTPLFFQLHLIGFSFLWLITIACLNVILIFKLRKQHAWLATLLLPYLFWLIFATYLNGMIWALNFTFTI